MRLETGIDDLFSNKQLGNTVSLGKLEERLGQIWEVARDFGLDPFPTNFEVIPAEMMHEVASTGLPVRASHWTFGKAFRELKTRYDYGLGTIYELVINSNPAQAFLLENNSDIENTVVMAHVLGHTDFFKNNYLFGHTRRDMPRASAVSASRIEEYEFTHGKDEVEQILDAALSIAEHYDPHQPIRLSKQEQISAWQKEYEKRKKPKERSGEFDDLFESLHTPPVKKEATMPIPLDPERDLLGFIADFAPFLKDWQRDILQIVRMESLYFHPQRRTKISNEGWAAYWHKRIMHEMSNRRLLTQEEDFRWVEMHAGVVTPSPTRLNPYHFGMYMFDFLEDYFNGNLTNEENHWLEGADLPVYPKYNGEFVGSPGHAKVFSVRGLDDDQSLVRNYFNKIPSDRMELYTYKENESPYGGDKYSVIDSRGWEKIRDWLVASMNNCGNPYLTITDSDYRGNRSLYIKHLFEGWELDMGFLSKTLPFIHRLWGRSVFLETKVKGRTTVVSFNGERIDTNKP